MSYNDENVIPAKFLKGNSGNHQSEWGIPFNKKNGQKASSIIAVFGNILSIVIIIPSLFFVFHDIAGSLLHLRVNASDIFTHDAYADKLDAA